jgi:hypothetical protein
MFYPNGLFRFGLTSTSVNPENLLTSFEKENKEFYNNVPWGIYQISGDTIYTQYIQNLGVVYGNNTLYRNYRILPDKKISCIYFSNNYDITNNKNDCNNIAQFHSLAEIRDWRECPLLKKKWFLQKPK